MAHTVGRIEQLTTLNTDVDHAIALANDATHGATEGCTLTQSVALLISQRNNARHYADTFKARLKELGDTEFCT